MNPPDYLRREAIAPAPVEEFPGFVNVYAGAGLAEPRDEDALSAHWHRRQFLTYTLAGAAAATLASCRRPDLPIVPYSAVPEDRVGHVVHGLPTFYATAQPRPFGSLPLLVESHDGRPTKIEGHPRHPASLGSTDAFAQAAILDLYSPDRVMSPRSSSVVERGVSRRWDDFDRFARILADRLRSAQGQGFAVLAEQVPSPALRRIREHLRQNWPQAQWYTFEPVDYGEVLRGTEIAFGQPLLPTPDLEKIDCLLVLDSDCLGIELDSLMQVRRFARRRQGPPQQFNRLYVVESTGTLTGFMADHRLRLPASLVGAFLLALTRELSPSLPGKLPELPARVDEASGRELPESARRWLAPLARDLLRHRGRCAILPGYRQPAYVHALAHTLNAALEASSLWEFRPPPPEMLEAGLPALTDALRAGRIDTLVILGGNPVLTAPADLQFAAALRQARTTIRVGLYYDQTSELCHWHLPLSHFLESWGDTESSDGTLCCIQPLIEPLLSNLPSPAEQEAPPRGGRSALEILALLTQFPHPRDGKPVTSYVSARSAAYELVRTVFAARAGLAPDDPQLSAAFQRYKQLGFLPPEQDKQRRSSLRLTLRPLSDIQRALPSSLPSAPQRDALEVTFHPDYSLYDGRYLFNAWLQELPDPISKLVWDNAALISPQTAQTFGLTTGDVIRLRHDSYQVEIPVFVLPGQADYSLALHFGQCGELRMAHITGGGGTNVFPLRTSQARYILTSVRLEKTGRRATLVTTQEHGVIPHGRDIVREVDLSKLRQPPSHSRAPEGSHSSADHNSSADHSSGHSSSASTPSVPLLGLPPDGHLSEEDLRRGYQAGYGQVPPPPMPARDKQRRFPLDLARPERLDSPFQWGMVIDLSLCTGCSACVLACQVENNIPVVGKYEVQRNREMHWLRIDRYFSSTDGQTADADPRVITQPLACLHCEQAPCEQVCPVNAAVHSPEGLNLQVYNRCIGTRYCANACPYKARRFNWFDYNKRHLDALRVPTPLTPEGAALTRSLLPESLRMLKNPDVTVRMRGVMEKCTYCVQRLERAKYGAKIAAAEVAQGRRTIPVDASFRPDGPASAYRKPQDPKSAGYDLDRWGRVIVPDGLVRTACQAVCPTQAIIFGNVLDPHSAVAAAKLRAGEYALLGELNTKPRTSYLPRLRNPNPELT